MRTASWAQRADQTYRFELRKFRVTEIHDKAALVDEEVWITDKTERGPYGPDHGSKPFINSFTFEDGRWRACE
jgi:hypothetical protein